MSKIDDKIFCPFTLGQRVPSYCCEDKCMAWQPPIDYSPSSECYDTGEPRIPAKHYDGYCKLINK